MKNSIIEKDELLSYGFCEYGTEDSQDRYVARNDLYVEELDPNEGMSFGAAIALMKKGKKVARKGWNGKGMWLCIPLVDGPKEIPAKGIWGKPNADYAEQNGGTVKVMPYITMKTADGSIVMGWLASQTDMLAEDWIVVE